MNKIINIIILTLIGAGCFSAGLYYSIIEFEEQVSKWDSNYQIITDKVLTFEKVSDPETIRLYVKELNKILDDIRFLGYIVDSGQLADGAMMGYFEKYNAKLDDINRRLIELYVELTGAIEQLRGRNTMLYDDINENLNLIESLNVKLTEQAGYLRKMNAQLEKDIDSLEIKLDAAGETFFGKYIFVE